MRGFYRSRDQKWIAGVCGGLAERFSINPNLVRLIFVGLGLWRPAHTCCLPPALDDVAGWSGRDTPARNQAVTG